MLKNLRGFSNTKLAGVLIAIIIVPFVFWGMGSVFSGGNTNNVAKINNKSISTQDFLQYVNQSRINLEYVKENIENNVIEEILTGLVSNKLLEMEIESLNASLSENILANKIRSDEKFVDDKKSFSRLKYEKFLLENNLTAPIYEIKLKDQELKKNLFDYISGGLISPYFLKNKILVENTKDIKIAKIKKLKENLIKRLTLNNDKIRSIIKSIKTISKFKDPVDVDIETWKRPNGLKLKKVSIPIGIIGVIYESRPNVTSDVSTLCFKSGNCVILRGGSEAYFSNKILANLFRKSLEKNKINKNFVQFIENKNRKLVDYMLSKMSKYIDVVIPRGGKSLVKKVQDLSSVPVIGHLEGMCHTYIDKDANLKMAKKILINAKLRNTSICGATETLLIHKNKSKNVNEILNELTERGCYIYADRKISKLFNGNSKLANNKTWSKEHLSAKISVKLVNNINDAVNHINKYGTMHTDAIITNNKISAKFFMKNVKSSIAIHNSSTQYADGGEFGFGGEVGISTNKLPPRGPVGLNQLVSYKYEIYGSGQTRK